MKLENLRTLIRESINEYIKEIDDAAENAAMEARIAKCDEAIATREAKLARIDENDELKEMVDGAKIKEIQNEIKELKKAKLKFERIAEKKAAKKAKKSAPKDEKEVTTDAPIDETDVMAEMDLEKENTEEALNESFLKMQKLAGVITEAQYREKIKEAEGDITPEQAAQMSLTIVNKAENDQAINNFAAEIAKDPKKSQELLNFLKKQGINPTSLNETIEDNAKRLALRFAKTADEKVTESLFEGNGRDITGRVMTGLASTFGGAVAAPWLAEKFGVFVHDYVNAFGDKITNPEAWVPLAGAAAGILLTIIGAKVYDLMTGQ